MYTAAFRAWLQEALDEPPEGVRRALRRSAAPVFGRAPMAMGRSDACKRPAGRWRSARDFPAAWRHVPFDRVAEIDARERAPAGLADVQRAVESARQSLLRSRRGAAPERSDSARGVVRDHRPGRMGIAARGHRPRPRSVADTQGERLQVQRHRDPYRVARGPRRAGRRAHAVQA